MFLNKRGLVLVLGLAYAFSTNSFSSVASNENDYSVDISYTSDVTNCSVIIPAKIEIPKKYCGSGFDVGFHVTNLDSDKHLTLKVCDGMSLNSELSLKRVGVKTDSVLQEVYALLLDTDGNTALRNKTILGSQAFSGEEVINRIGPVYCMAFDKNDELTKFESDVEATVTFKVSIDSN